MTTTESLVPPALRAALPQRTNLALCDIVSYGEIRDRVDDYIDASDDAVVVVTPGWTADDGNAAVRYPYAESGEEAAQDYVGDGDWGFRVETDWIDVDAWRVGYLLGADGRAIKVEIDRASHKIALEPEEPECEQPEHDWRSPYSVLGGVRENPGVWGHGGGVVIREVCAHCGRYRITDTWAQHRATGEQGLTSTSYEDADERSLAWIEAR